MRQTRQLTIIILLVFACIGRVAGQGKVYWLKNGAGTISRANIDGTTTETLVTGALCADGAFISSSLGKVMWVEGCGKMALKMANLDGTNVQILDTFNTTGRQISPRGVTFDESTGNIYVIGQGGYARGNMSSLPLTATQSSTIAGRGIAINSGTGKLYFTTQNDNKVRVCNTDGTGVDTIRTNLATAWGVQVDADNGKVYFSDNLGIYKTNLDGTGFQTVYAFPTSLTFASIAIDVRNDRLFWASNGGVINRATLSGANPTQIITGQGGIFAMAVGASSSRQASNINFNTITANSANAIWTKGDGAGRVAFLKADTLSVPIPLDGTTYTANATFGSGTQIGTSGWFCVYSGTDSTVTVTGLAANTTYRMMVMESSGTGSNVDYNITYANLNPNKFRTGGITVTTPTVFTASVTSITSNSAILGGNITSSGGASVTERGVVYSTTANPTISSGTKRAIGFNIGTYGTNITGFSPSTLYYFRAYAINSAGTAYGSDSTFTTLAAATFAPTVSTAKATLIGETNATLGGNVISIGTAPVTERGVVYATTVNPTTADTKVQIGAGLGTFSQNVTGLTAATLYHVRAYAINSVGTRYGADSTFTTSSLPTIASSVSTSKVTLIGITNATLGGNVSDSGTASVTERGVVYATTANPSTANTKVSIGTGLGTFSQNITGLTAATLYHVRAYAINSVGTSYGADSTFTTLPALVLANVITGNATNISYTSATLAGNVVNDGGANVTERGIVFATSSNPTTAESKVQMGTGTGVYSQTVSALTANTTYHYRAYAINSVGTAYGVDSVFATLPIPEFNKNITNAFSPDGDGINETWVIDNASELNGHEIVVFNIFGQEVFHQTGYTTAWDGKIDGNPVPSGEYYYLIKGSKINIKGALLIKNKQ